jgi:hydrogenase maturation protease
MIAVIGCGNTNRSDDGAGPCVIRALRERGGLGPPDAVRLLDAGTDGIAVMFAARGCSALIVVDACRPLGEPGAIYEVPGEELERSYQPSMNLHDFRWNHALYAGRQIWRAEFPSDVTVYLVGAESLDLGLALTPAVERAATALVEKIADRVRDLQSRRSGPP